MIDNRLIMWYDISLNILFIQIIYKSYSLYMICVKTVKTNNYIHYSDDLKKYNSKSKLFYP
jgi:hypothetical protein